MRVNKKGKRMQTISYETILAAATRIDGHAVKTPLVESSVLNRIAGRRVLCKAEALQKTGSFKYRGAFNRLSQLSGESRARGVVAFSSGNHAQGVSRAAKELGISAVIVMPSDAPKVKVEGVLADGATIVSYDRFTESREGISANIAKREGRTVVPSYDDLDIINGQGTAGLEIAHQAKALGVTLDAAIICMGGGGLCAGTGTALKALSPNINIYGAEPADYDDHRRSFHAGRRIRLENPPHSLCDALMTPTPGAMTWPINFKHLSDVYGVSDQECLMTMALAKRHLDIALEPGGAAALAAALSGRLPCQVTAVAVTLSGGNVDPAVTALSQSYFSETCPA